MGGRRRGLLLSFPFAALLCINLVWVSSPTLAEQRGVVDRIVAIVNEDAITLSELEEARRGEHPGAIEKAERTGQKEKDVRREVLERLIEWKLVDQTAKRQGIVVTEVEIDAAIDEVLKANNLTRDALKQALKEQGVSEQSYRDRVKDQLKKFKLINIEVRAKVAISEDEVKTHYQRNLDSFRVPVKVRPKIIFFPIPPRVSDEERKAAEEEARRVRGLIDQGQDFDEVARNYSKGPNPEAGGDMGWMELAQMEESFRKATESLRPGEVSPVVFSRGGIIIVKLEEKRGGDLLPYDQVKGRIRSELSNRYMEERFSEWMQGVKQKAHIEVRL